MAGTEKSFTESSDANRELYMHHPAFSIGTFLTSSSLLIVGNVQKVSNNLFTYISFLIFIQCFGATTGSTTIIPTPTLNVTSQTYSACFVPPSSCPLSDNNRDLHIACLFNYQGSCPPGWTYFCDDKSSKYLVEGCLERHKCPKGTVNYIDFDPSSRTAVMKCKKCQEHFIQREEHDTAQDYITGCDTLGVSLHILQNLDKMVQVYDGGTTDYSQYVCDTSKGYSEKRHITLCNVSFDCSCEQGVTCDNPDFPVLLPNGKCDKQCAVDRDIHLNCKLYELNSSIDSTNAAHSLSTNSIDVTNLAVLATHDNVEVKQAATKKPADSSKTTAFALVNAGLSLISALLLIVVVVVGVCVYKRGWQICRWIHVVTNYIDGDMFEAHTAGSVNFNIYERNENNNDSGNENPNPLEIQNIVSNGDSATNLEIVSDNLFCDMPLIPPTDKCPA